MTSSGFQINYDQVQECIQEMDSILSELMRTVSVVKGINSSGETYEAIEVLNDEVGNAVLQLRTMIMNTRQYVKSTLEYHKSNDVEYSAQAGGKAGG